VGRINPDYAGISQHDVHELLEFFIDKIHEDLNKVGKKPYTEIPEGDGTNDVDISRLAWERHGMRHDSIVKDVFGGQLRSQLVCPACSRVSVKFDYFTTLQLAIPLQSEVVVKVLYVPTVQTVAALSDPPMLVSIKLELNKNGRALKAAVAERISNEFDVIIDPTSLELFEVDPETRLPVAVMMNSTVISEITGSIVFAYSKQDKAHDGFIFIFNRAIIFPESIESEDDASVEVLGYPILISFETSWSVAKVRFQIWLQVFHTLYYHYFLLIITYLTSFVHLSAPPIRSTSAMY
jgi:hypothetical protein